MYNVYKLGLRIMFRPQDVIFYSPLIIGERFLFKKVKYYTVKKMQGNCLPAFQLRNCLFPR